MKPLNEFRASKADVVATQIGICALIFLTVIGITRNVKGGAIMSKNELRFGVFSEDGERASTWKLFWKRYKSGLEIYLVNRGLGGSFKTSFHHSGKCHTAFEYGFFHSVLMNLGLKSRFADEWDWPAECFDGVTVFYQIQTLPEGIRVEDKSLQKKGSSKSPHPKWTVTSE